VPAGKRKNPLLQGDAASPAKPRLPRPPTSSRNLSRTTETDGFSAPAACPRRLGGSSTLPPPTPSSWDQRRTAAEVPQVVVATMATTVSSTDCDPSKASEKKSQGAHDRSSSSTSSALRPGNNQLVPASLECCRHGSSPLAPASSEHVRLGGNHLVPASLECEGQQGNLASLSRISRHGRTPSFCSLTDNGALRSARTVVSDYPDAVGHSAPDLDSFETDSCGGSTCCRIEMMCDKTENLMREMCVVVTPPTPCPPGVARTVIQGTPCRILPPPAQPPKPPAASMTGTDSPAVGDGEITDLRFRVSRIELELDRANDQREAENLNEELVSMKMRMESAEEQLSEARAEIQETKRQVDLLSQTVAAFPAERQGSKAPCARVTAVAQQPDAFRSVSAPLVAQAVANLWAAGVSSVTAKATKATTTVTTPIATPTMAPATPTCPGSPPLTTRYLAGCLKFPAGVPQSPLATARPSRMSSTGSMTTSLTAPVCSTPNSCSKSGQSPLRHVLGSMNHVHSAPCIAGTAPLTARVYGTQLHFGRIIDENALSGFRTARGNVSYVYSPARVAG